MTSYAVSTLLGRVEGFLDSDTMPVMAAPGFIAHALIEPVTRWPEAPTPTAELWISNGDLCWHDPVALDQARSNAWAAAKRARDEAEAADFEFDGTLYQPDVAKITGAVLAALLPRPEGDPFAIDWTVADNSVVTLTAAQVMRLGLTLTDRINAIHQYGRELRALIENAVTPAEAYGYTWNSTDV
jgi:hypothetical protein